jgi:spermidine/putrescine transport system permease protein
MPLRCDLQLVCSMTAHAVLHKLGMLFLGLLVILIFVMPFAILLIVGFGIVPGSPYPTLTHFRDVLFQPLYQVILLRSLLIAALATLAALLIALPLAFSSAFWTGRRSTLLLLLISAPSWTSDLILLVSWQQMLTSGGWLHATLLKLGVPQDVVFEMLYSKFAVWSIYLCISIPMAVLITYAGLKSIDRRQIEAAMDLGDPPVPATLRIALPKIYRSFLLGYFVIFVPLLGEFSTPSVVGGTSGAQFANLISNNFSVMRDLSTGAAASMMLIGVASLGGLLLALLGLVRQRNRGG